MTNPSLLRRFLAFERIQALVEALREQGRAAPSAGAGTGMVACAILIAALPMLSFYTDPGLSGIDFKTLLVGVSACLAILYRRRAGIHLTSVSGWKRSLHLTHVAFALGCVPTLLILLVYPEALYQLELAKSPTGAAAPPPALGRIVLTIAGIAAWAALTEEFIYRGLLISVIRRWSALPTPRARDTVAVVVSALIFGLAHLPSWGPAMSFALFGLGVGFGAAYLAIGEGLLPLIVYHFMFDFLSLTFAIFARGS